MGVFDKFLNIMKLDDEDEYEEYDEFDDDEEYDDETSKKSFFKKKEKDFDYDLEDAIVKETKVSSKSAPSKVTPITRKRSGGGSSMEVCVIKPSSFEDSREITETLLSGTAVVLNFEGLDMDLAQRIIDFTCGTCVAIDGNLRKVSSYIVIVTPKSVNISGDLQDFLADAFEVPGIKKDF